MSLQTSNKIIFIQINIQINKNKIFTMNVNRSIYKSVLILYVLLTIVL